ncbi:MULTISPECIES: winged helix-turn-helix transcriptional regulator [Paraburkholderia]
MILIHLAHDARRYGHLKRASGAVSQKLLIRQLEGIGDRWPRQ